MRYKFSEQAQQGLNEIVDFIALNKPNAAKSVVYAITDKLKLLTTMPEMGRVIDNINGDNIYLIAARKYMQYQIFYRILDDAQIIDVLLIWDSHRNIPALYEKWRDNIIDIG